MSELKFKKGNKFKIRGLPQFDNKIATVVTQLASYMITCSLEYENKTIELVFSPNELIPISNEQLEMATLSE